MFAGDWNFGDLCCDDPVKKEIEMSYNIDDIVVCKLLNGVIVQKNEKYDNKISLKIIGRKESAFDSTEYVVYVPEYENSRIQINSKVNRTVIKNYGIDPRFLDEYMAYIRPNHICSVDYKADGRRCENCEEYYDKAAANMPDGSFYCSACKLNPWR